MRIAIRELFLVTTIVAVSVAWYVDHHRLAAVVNDQEERAECLKSMVAGALTKLDEYYPEWRKNDRPY